MSVKVMSWVWEHSQATGRDLLVLLAIADRADDEGGGAWPSQSTIAAKTRISVRSVQRALDDLVEMGELAIEQRAGGGKHTPARYRPNAYRVLMPEGRQIDTPAEPRGDTSDAEGRQDGQQGATLLSHETSLIHPDTSARPGATTCGVCAGDDWIFNDEGHAVACPQCASPKLRAITGGLSG